MDRYTWEVGKYLGYPECCIKWFIEERLEKFPDVTPLTPQQEAAHGHRGFIPCPTCAQQVTRETLHKLIKDRKSPNPFPDVCISEFKQFKHLL